MTRKKRNLQKRRKLCEEMTEEVCKTTMQEEPEEMDEPEPEPDSAEPIELAMPVYTAEELLQKAHAAGDDPKVIEDSCNRHHNS